MVRSTVISGIIALVALASCRPCATQRTTKQLKLEFTPEAKVPAFDLSYERTTLRGGLPALTSEVPQGVPVTLTLWVRAGTDHEMQGEQGASHLARRVLLSASTDEQAAQAAARVREAGGAVESWTSRRLTVITVHAPAARIDDALRSIAPFIKPPHPRADALAQARKAVSREADAWWAQPEARARDALHSLLLGPSRATALFPDLDVLEGTGLKSLDAFMKRTYRAGRMVLAASVHGSAMEALLSLPAPRPGGGADELEPEPHPGGITRILEPPEPDPAGATGALVMAGVALPAMCAPDGAAGHLLARWLTSKGPGTASEYVTEIALTSGALEATLDATPDGSLLTLRTSVERGREAEAVRSLSTAMALASALPPRAPALGHEAAGAAASMMMQLQDPFTGAQTLARHEHLCSEALPPEDFIAGLFAVDPGSVASLAGLLAEPGSLGIAVVQAPGDGHDPPAALEAASLDEVALEAVRRVADLAGKATEACGMEGPSSECSMERGMVLARRTAGEGSVAVTGLLGAGSLHDPQGQEGTAKLLSLLMARRLDSAVRESPGLDPRFVTASASYGPDHVAVHIVVPAGLWLEGVLAVRAALMTPALDSTSFDDARSRAIQMTAAERDPAVESTRTALGMLLGQAGGYTPDGSVVSLGTSTPAEVARFHAAALSRAVVVSVAGELGPEEVCSGASVALHAPTFLPPAGKLTLAAPSPVVQPGAGAAQGPTGGGAIAWITAAWAAPARVSGDHWSLQVLARLLDGPGGILHRRIIDEKGLATMIEVDTLGLADWGVLFARIQAPAPNADAVREALLEAMRSIEELPPTQAQLDGLVERILMERSQSLALPAPAARLMAAEALVLGPGSAPEEADAALSEVTPERIAGLAGTLLSSPGPAYAVVAP